MSEQDETQPKPDTTADSAVEHGQHPATDGAPEATDTPGASQEATEVPEDDDTTAALRKARKEAADRRVAAREAQERAEALQADLESTRQRLTTIQDRWLSEKLFTTGVGFDAFRAAGHGAHDVLDDNGDIDAEKFAKAVTDTAERFGRISSPSGIIPSAGTGNPRPVPEVSWGSILNPQQ